MLQIKDFQFNAFQCNCFVIWDETKECVICDPGMIDVSEKRMLADFIAENGLSPKAILLTHGHGDHIYGVKFCVDTYSVPVYMDPADWATSREHVGFCQQLGLPELELDYETIDVKEEDIIRFGNHEFIVISTPGHTPGGVCYLCIDEKLILTGDTLFRGTIGRTDLSGGDYDTLMTNIKGKLMGLAGDIDVLPGHGGCTTIADEVQKNPFLAPFNE